MAQTDGLTFLRGSIKSWSKLFYSFLDQLLHHFCPGFKISTGEHDGDKLVEKYEINIINTNFVNMPKSEFIFNLIALTATINEIT